MYIAKNYMKIKHQKQKPAYTMSIQKRKIWVSLTSIKTQEEMAKRISASKAVIPEDFSINLTDFGSGAGVLDVKNQLEFLKKSSPEIDLANANVIINVANSGNDWEKRLGLIESSFGGRKPNAIMLVKGSGGLALSTNTTDQTKLQQRYIDMCRYIKKSGINLALVGDITGHSEYVKNMMRYKIEQLGADIINTHPIVDPSMVTQETREFLAKYILAQFGVNNHEIRVILGQLRHTATLYENYARDDGESIVSKTGQDLYPISDYLWRGAESGNWDSLTELGVRGTKKIISQIAPNQKVSQSIQTRIGLGVGIDDLQAVASIIHSTNTDITGYLIKDVENMNYGMTDKEYSKKRPKDVNRQLSLLDGNK